MWAKVWYMWDPEMILIATTLTVTSHVKNVMLHNYYCLWEAVKQENWQIWQKLVYKQSKKLQNMFNQSQRVQMALQKHAVLLITKLLLLLLLLSTLPVRHWGHGATNLWNGCTYILQRLRVFKFYGIKHTLRYLLTGCTQKYKVFTQSQGA